MNPSAKPFEPESQRFLDGEREVELRSAELNKELRLPDLVLTEIVYIVGLYWTGTAAKVGSAHALFWFPAVALFFIPSAMVVLHLNREMPLEGGLYQWAKLRFGGLMGFLVACNMWASMVLVIASNVSAVAGNVAYAAGPRGAWMAESNAVIFGTSLLVTSALALAIARGLVVAKWVHNAGGVANLTILGLLAAVAIPRWMAGRAAIAPMSFTPPSVSLLNLNLLGKMAFGALCGFDGAAIFSGECRDPQVARSIRRSVWLAAPAIATIYVLATASVLVFVQPANVDLINPTTQALAAASPGGWMAPVGAALLTLVLVGFSAVAYNAVIRLPMVAGWDHLLPAWLSRLHPRYRTPTGSIGLIGGLAMACIILGHLGAGSQEAFQLLNNAGIICWALTYLVMFAIPLVASGEKPSRLLRAAAGSGFVMTLLYTVLAIFPVIEVSNPAEFAVKAGGVILAINAAGAWYFHRARRFACHVTQ
jgi:glutamate:GABA antiporter